ncbi:hypothetical protein WICPIJ_000555 [Wickerhamomyces pijperi]|uniref:Uncharacterized protein n=1 Tax=Wickerhamomyces pijperi TaxID=599730 RepID=A0A9P8TSC4_WICPI|nr:hypothetical protein WICPIJ_000555 [Wickerhamomyces pijperi]
MDPSTPTIVALLLEPCEPGSLFFRYSGLFGIGGGFLLRCSGLRGTGGGFLDLGGGGGGGGESKKNELSTSSFSKVKSCFKTFPDFSSDCFSKSNK